MKLRYENPNYKIQYGFLWITVDGMWWDYEACKWVKNINPNKDYTSTVFCNCVRKFRKHLNRNPEISGRATLVSQWVGYNVYG